MAFSEGCSNVATFRTHPIHMQSSPVLLLGLESPYCICDLEKLGVTSALRLTHKYVPWCVCGEGRRVQLILFTVCLCQSAGSAGPPTAGTFALLTQNVRAQPVLWNENLGHCIHTLHYFSAYQFFRAGAVLCLYCVVVVAWLGCHFLLCGRNPFWEDFCRAYILLLKL